MKSHNKMSAIVLAGGMSTRMKQQKALLPVSPGVTLIQKVAQNIDPYFDEIIISSNLKEEIGFLPYKVVKDEEKGQGPLMGILSGLKASENEVNFVIACDIPEIHLPFLKKMILHTKENDIVVPISDVDKYEPLFAFYKKSLIPKIEELLKKKIRKVIELFSICRTSYIPLSRNGWYYNLNTIENYEEYIRKNLTEK
jgi:molybdopterin-guanine dinucleotide biosynthesis protein A